MKKIEELLNIDLGRKFDTPKKLNRSGAQVPAEIVEKLENGEFTSEMIEDLKGGTATAGLFGTVSGAGYPIFYYRTCLTIHGAWPEISRDRIQGYKNVIQNKNGSLEIRWSAIDAGKIQRIADGLQGSGCPWRYSRDSNGRRFTWMKAITKATYQAVRAEMEPRALELAALPIYGYINLYVASVMFQSFLVMEVNPLAVKEEDISKVILSLSGLSSQEYEARKIAYQEKQEKERIERNARMEEYKRQAAEEKQKLTDALFIKQEEIKALPASNDIKAGILVRATGARADDVKFGYYRYDGPGSFGRIKFSYASAATLGTEGGLQWKEHRQEHYNELKDRLKDTRLFKAAEVRRKFTPQIPQVEHDKKVLFTI